MQKPSAEVTNHEYPFDASKEAWEKFTRPSSSSRHKRNKTALSIEVASAPPKAKDISPEIASAALLKLQEYEADQRRATFMQNTETHEGTSGVANNTPKVVVEGTVSSMKYHVSPRGERFLEVEMQTPITSAEGVNIYTSQHYLAENYENWRFFTGAMHTGRQVAVIKSGRDGMSSPFQRAAPPSPSPPQALKVSVGLVNPNTPKLSSILQQALARYPNSATNGQAPAESTSQTLAAPRPSVPPHLLSQQRQGSYLSR